MQPKSNSLFNRRAVMVNFTVPPPKGGSAFTRTTAPTSPGDPKPFLNPKVMPDPRSNYRREADPRDNARTEPLTAPRSDIRAKTKTGTKSQKQPRNNPRNTGTKTGRKNNGDEPGIRIPPILVNPPSRKQEREEAAPMGPQSTTPYLGGPAIFTHSPKYGKVSEIPGLMQLPDNNTNGNENMGNIRCLMQVIDARWLSQHQIFEGTESQTVGFDKTHTKVMDEYVNKLGVAYQNKANVNTAYFDTFKSPLIWTYFSDTLALYAELTCLLQRAAYFKDDSKGMENPLLDRIGILLNTTNISSIRDAMARTLRYQYLPGYVADRTYEMFQTYRLGQNNTATSAFYVTPAMEELIDILGTATDANAVNNALNAYNVHCSKLIELATARGTNAEVGSTYIWKRISVNPTGAGGREIQVLGDPMFGDNGGALSSAKRRQLNTYFNKIAETCDLRLLNDPPKGNSESHFDVGFCDEFNNRKFYGKENAAKVTAPQGVTKSASIASAVSYASEMDPSDIELKNCENLLENFQGCAPLFFVTSTNYLRNYLANANDCSRYYLKERDPNFGITFRDYDIRCNSLKDVADMTSPAVKPLHCENYVRKVVQVSANPTVLAVFANPDGTGAAAWFFTKGELLDHQLVEANRQL